MSLRHVLVVMSLMTCVFAYAQTPNLTNGTPGTAFPGGSFSAEMVYANTGAPGYGPYIRIITPEEISFNSASFLGSPAATTTVGTFPEDLGNPGAPTQLEDPRSGDMVSGPQKGTFIIVLVPISAVVDGGPDLTTSASFTIDADTAIGENLDVTVQPVYQYGDTAVGTNGPIVGAANTKTVTTALYTISKSASVSKVPPGPKFQHTYSITIDAAEDTVGQDKSLYDVIVEDDLPSGIQYVKPPGTTLGGAGGVNDSVTGEPAGVGGTVTVEADRIDGTSGGSDLTVSFPVYVTDILDESVVDTANKTNQATINAEYPDDTPLGEGSDNASVTVKHLTLGKSANPGTAVPGDDVDFTLIFKLTEYGTANALVLDDVLPDGTTWVGHQSFSVDTIGGGAPIAITPTTTVNGDGTTDISYDVHAVTGDLPPGSVGTLVYRAVIDQEYASTGEKVLANDPLSKTATATFSLTDGATNGTDTASASVRISKVTIDKTIVAPKAEYMPGDDITYRLTMNIPSGDTKNVVFEDFFPLPVLDATTLDANTNLAANVDIDHAPTDTLGLTPDSITVDAGTNSVEIAWPDIETTTPQVLAVDLTITVEADPFADDLTLNNLFQASTVNSPAVTSAGLQPVAMTIRAPELTIAKGVSATDNGDATIDPAPATKPVDGDVENADGGDQMTFTITVENIGGAPAHDVTVTDSLPTGLTLMGGTVAVEDGDGNGLAFSGDLFGAGLVLDDPLAENDGTEGAPYSTDTAIITYDVTIDTVAKPSDELENGASVTWASQGGADDFPTKSDGSSTTIVQPTISSSVTAVTPGYAADLTKVQIGEVVTHTTVITIPEGTCADARFTDLLDAGLAFTDVVSITASSGDLTTSVGTWNDVRVAASITNSGSGETNKDRQLELDFDTITNSNTNDAVAETLTIVTRARIVNDAIVNRGSSLNNRTTFYWDDSKSIAHDVRDSAANVVVIEPTLQIATSISSSDGDAGDTITVTVDISHTGASDGDAFDVSLSNVVPAGFSYAGNLSHEAGLAPDSGPAEAGGTVTAGWNSFPDGQTSRIKFDITLADTVSPDETVNVTTNLEWESLATADEGGLPNCPNNSLGVERTGDVGDPGGANNDYNDSDTKTMTIEEAAVAVAIDSISPGGAGGGDMTCGDTVTYQITVTLPEGTTNNLEIVNDLPAGLSFQSAALDTTGFNGSVTLDDASGSGAVDTGIDVTLDFAAATTVTSDNVGGNNSFVVNLQARVEDSSANDGLPAVQNKTNNVSLDHDDRTTAANDSVSADFAEPDIQITKSMSPASGLNADDVVTITLTVTNNGTAPAYDIAITDTLNDTGALFDLTTIAENATPAGYSYAYGNPTVTFTADAATALAAGGANVAFVFTATVKDDVLADSSFGNTAAVTCDSQDGVVTADRDSSDTGNDSVTTAGLSGDIAVTADSEDWTGGFATAAIGEILTMEASFTIPEGLTREDGTNPIISVVLPVGLQYQAGTAKIRGEFDVSVSGAGYGAIPAVDTAIVPTIDGQTLEFDLGDIQNDDNDVNDEMIIITFDQLVLNSADNNRDSQKTTRGYLNYLPRTGGAQSLDTSTSFRIAEPNLTLAKVANPTTADGGATVTFTVVLTNTSGTRVTRAWEPVISDILPARYINPAVTSSTLSRGATDITASANFAGNTLTADMTTLAAASRYLELDETITVVYTAEIDPSVTFEEEITNTATAVCTSLPGNKGTGDATPGDPGDADGERTGSGVGDNDLAASDTATVTAGKPTITKVAADDTLQILEKTTVTLTAALPVGTSDNFVITDNLPNGLNYTGDVTITVPGSNFTATKSPPDPAAGSDPLQFDFGTVTNSAAGSQNIVIEYDVEVKNIAANQDGVNLQNTASISYDDASDPDSTTETISVVEPNLTITKTITAGAAGSDAGDTISYQVEVENTDAAGTAYGVELRDVLPADLLGGTPTFDNVGLTNPGNAVVLNSDGVTPLSTAHDSVVTTTNANDTLTWQLFNLPPSTKLTITYDAVVVDDAPMGASLTNNVTAVYDSKSDRTGRDNSDSSDDDDGNLNNYGETASATATLNSSVAVQHAFTSGGPNFTIGDEVGIDIRIDLKEGTVDNVVVTEVLGTGLDFVEFDALVTGKVGITTENDLNLPANVTEAPAGTIEFNLGEVTNPPDGDGTNDYLIVRLKAIVADHIGNTRGTERTSQASVATVIANAGPVDLDLTVIEPNLAITKVADDDTPPLGDLVTFTVTVQHDGANGADAQDVVLTDAIPSGLTYVTGSHAGDGSVDESDVDNPEFDLGSITLVEGDKQFAFKCRVDLDATVGDAITNTISCDYSSQNGSPTVEREYNDTGTEQVTPVTPTVIDAVKTVAFAAGGDADGDGKADPGDTLEYTISLTNGPDAVTNVVFTDTIPANTAFVGGTLTTTLGAVDESGDPNLVVNVGAMGGGATVTIKFQVTIDAGAPEGAVISNQGLVDSDQTVPEATDADGVDGNGDQPTTVTVAGEPDLEDALYVEKFVDWTNDADASGDISPNDTVRYYFVFHNLGGTELTGVSLTDTIPAGLTYVGASKFVSGGGNTINVAGQNVNVAIDPVAVGDYEYAYFDVTVDAPLVNNNGGANDETFTNQATADSDQTDPVATDENGDPSDGNQSTTFTATSDASGEPAIDVEKRVSLAIDADKDGRVGPNDTLEYVIAIGNLGAAKAENVFLNDAIPANTSVVGGSVGASQGAVVTEDPVKINVGDVSPGGLVKVWFRVTVDGGTDDGTVISNQATVTGDNGVNENSDDNGSDGDGKNPTLASIDAGGGGGASGGVPYGLATAVTDSSEAATAGANAAIGEVVTIESSGAFPVGRTREVTLIDTIPAGLTYVPNSAKLKRVFDTGIIASRDPNGVNAAASGTTVDLTDGTHVKIAGQVLTVFLGDVINSDSDIDDERFVLQFKAVVNNVAGNNRGSDLENRCEMTYLNGLAKKLTVGPATGEVTVQEPNVQISHTPNPGSITSSGGTVQYTVVITNPAGTNVTTAYDVAVTDNLSGDFTGLAVDSVTPTGGVAGVTDNTAGKNLNVIVDTFPGGGTLTIVYGGTTDSPLADGTIANDAIVTWTSLPGTRGTGDATPGNAGDSDGERTGAGGVNDNATSDGAPVDVGSMSIDKTITSAGPRYAIGDVVECKVEIAFPGGISLDDNDFTDVLDEGLTYVTGTLNTSFQADLSATKNPADFTRTNDAPAAGKETLALDFGTIANASGTVKTLTLTYNAVVDNILGNQNEIILSGTAKMEFDNPAGAGRLEVDATAAVTVGEPHLTSNLTVTGASTDLHPGDEVEYRIVVGNDGNRTAHDVVVSDAVTAGLESVASLNAFSVTGGGDTPTFINNGTSWSTNPFDIPAGGSVTIDFKENVTADTAFGSTVTNSLTVTFTSRDGVDANERDGATPGADQDNNAVLDNYRKTDSIDVVLNKKPIADPQTVTIDEDVDKIITLNGSDGDPGDVLTYRISTLPANGTLHQVQADGSTRGDAIESADTVVVNAAHKVIYRSAEHGNGNGHGNFQFTVTDDAATPVTSDPALVTVNVTAVPDTPEANAQTVTTDEDTDVTITLTGVDPDAGETNSLTYTVTSLPLNGTLYQTPDGVTRGAEITAVPTEVTNAERKLIYRGAPNQFGDNHGNFQFTVTDATARVSAAIQVTVNVEPVNDPPTITDIADQTIDEDAVTAAIPFTVADLETDPADLVVTAVSADQTIVPNENIVLGGSGANRTITISPPPDVNGVVEITVTVSDGELNASDSFTLTIAPINDPPTFRILTSIDNAKNPLNGIDLGANAAPAFADLDGDGDQDAIIGRNDGDILYFRNVGGANVPTFNQVTGDGNPFDGIDVGDRSVPFLIDLDGDGDQDVIVGNATGEILYFKNVGTFDAPEFSQMAGGDNPFDGIDVGANAAPILVDIDGDGDVDAFVGRLDGTVAHYENVGAVDNPAFAERTGANNPLTAITAFENARPAFADFDDDGDLDLVLGPASVALRFLENIGSATTAAFSESTGLFRPRVNADHSPALIDIDGDRAADGFVGAADGTISFFPNVLPYNVTARNATEDQAYAFVANVYDADDPNENLTISASTLPKWLELRDDKNGTARLSGTPLNEHVGSHTVTLKVEDDDGLFSEQTFTITVTPINDAPTFTSAPVTSVKEDENYSYSITTTDVDDLPKDLTITAVKIPDWLKIVDNGDGTASLAGTPGNQHVGDHQVTLRVADDDGAYTEQTFTITVLPVNDPPVFTSTPVTSVKEDENYSYSITTTDVDDLPKDLTITAVKIPYWLKLADHGDGTASLAGTPGNQHVGDHGVTLKVADDDGAHTEQTFTITVIPVNDPPVFTSTQVASVKEDEPYSYSITTTDVDDLPKDLTITAVKIPDWLKLADHGDGTASLAGTPENEHVGDHGVTLKVADDDGAHTEQTFTITVLPVNDPPVFTSTPIASVKEDEPYSYSITTTDVDDLPKDLTITTVKIPEWLKLVDNGDGTASLAGTPGNEHVGDHEVTLKVADDDGAYTEQTFTIMVLPVNDPPVFTSTPVASVKEDEPYSYSITTADVDDLPKDLTITTVKIPEWLKLVDNGDGTASLAGTPGNEHVGDHEVTLKVADDDGAYTEQTFTITVLPVNDPPVFTSEPVVEGVENELYVYDLTTDDIDDIPENLTITIVSAPPWLSLDDNGDSTGVLSGRPPHPGVYEVILRVMDDDDAYSDHVFTITVVDGEQVSCVLRLMVNPEYGGSTKPDTGRRHVVDAGSAYAVSAHPNDDHEFSSWTVLNGNVEIADAGEASTTVTLLSDATIVANFISEGIKVPLFTAVEPEGAGTALPNVRAYQVNLGQVVPIIATPIDDTYVFKKWRVDGPAKIGDPNLSSTSLVVNGAATATAVFIKAEDAIKLLVKVAVEGAGTATTYGDQYVEVGETRCITAIPNAGYVFIEWTTEGDVDIDAPYGATTCITVNGNSKVIAHFAKLACASAAGKVLINFHNKKDAADRAVLRQIPLSVKSFNPATDSVVVRVDGNAFEIDKDNGEFKTYPKGRGYRYKSHDKTVRRFKMDFKKGVWDFVAKNVELDSVDNVDGVDVILKVNDELFPMRYEMDEKVRWTFNSANNPSTSIDVKNGRTGGSMDIHRSRGVVTNIREDRDRLVIAKAGIQLPADDVFDPSAETVTLNIDDFTVIIPPGSFERNGEKFVHADKENGVWMTLDFVKDEWAVRLSQFSGWSKISTMDGLNVFLMIGDVVGSKLEAQARTVLRYKPTKRRYWEDVKAARLAAEE